MNILIYATAISTGGGIRIVDSYKKKYLDTEHNIIFLLSSNLIADESNIQVFIYNKIKKSILYRLFFNIFKAHKIVKENNIDQIISLNNTIILFTKVKQTIYLHQTLPFSDYNPLFFGNTYLWIFKNILGKYIIYSLKKADFIIIQSQWLNKVLSERIKIDSKKIIIEMPIDSRRNIVPYKKSYVNGKLHFFYPSGYVSYKNHSMIVDTLKKIPHEKLSKISIDFTFLPDENRKVKSLYKSVIKHSLPVNFLGYQNDQNLSKLYSNRILIFPSIVESFGLPILEAVNSKTPIIALDTEFSREITHDYKKITFFKDIETLKNILVRLVDHQINLEK